MNPPASDRPGGESTARRTLQEALQRELDGLQPGDFNRPPPVIPDHELQRRVGRGAYGEVWLARNTLGTWRAVKVVYRDDFEDAQPYEREFNGIVRYEPISRSHAGLIQVLHVGQNEAAGYFYYVMELADPAAAPGGGEFDSAGYRPRTLRTEMRQSQRLPAEAAARLTVRLAEALAHLHEHGLVHRDVKPGNVIFVNGQPKLADIGAVTSVAEARSFVGTEGFIPPEGPGTVAADLYSLGKLLYELATGRDRMDFPQLPPAGNSRVDEDALLELNEIVTRACAPEVRDRYRSAREFEADLSLFLAGRSLRDERQATRRLKLFRRLAFVSGLAVLLAVPLVWVDRTAVARAEQRARTEATLRTRAEAAEREGRNQLYTALLEQARALVRSGELGHRTRALDALRRAAAITNAVELRREVFAALALPDLQRVGEMALEADTTLVALDPTFARVATCRGTGPVMIRSITNETTLATLPAGTNLAGIIGEWSHDGRWLVVVRNYPEGEWRDIELWDVAKTRRVRTWPAIRFGAFALSPRNQQIALGAAGDSVILHAWNGTQSDQVIPLTGPAVQMCFAPDGGRLAVVAEVADGQLLSVHNLHTGALDGSHRFERPLGAIDWHPQGRWIAVPDHGGNVHLWAWATGEVRTLGRHKAQAARANFTAEGRYLVSGGWERETIVWDLKAMRRIFHASLDGFHLQFAADGRRCALFQVTSHLLGFFEFTSAINHREFPEDLGSLVRTATFSPDGHWLAASGHDRLAVWDLRQEAPAALVSELSSARPAFSPDSAELYACDDTNGSRWRLVAQADGPPRLEALPFPVSAGFSSVCANSNALYLTSIAGTQVFPSANPVVPTPNWVCTTNGLNGVSADGRWLAMYQPFGRALHVYRLPDLSPAAVLPHPGSIGGFGFSPAGDELSVFSRNRVEFWRPGTWEWTRTLTNFNRLLYQPDGRGWWLGRDHREAGWYDSQTLDLLLPLPTGMIPLAIGPEGRRLVVSLDAQRLQLWDIAEVRRELRQLGMDWELTMREDSFE